ncbi:hypothetical protein P5673_031167, partial [Acropora cervicornis]
MDMQMIACYISRLNQTLGQTCKKLDYQNLTSLAVTVGKTTVMHREYTRNLGPWFDNHMAMHDHVVRLFEAFIRKYLTENSANFLIHAIVTICLLTPSRSKVQPYYACVDRATLVANRIIFIIVLLAYKSLNGMRPSYPRDLLQRLETKPRETDRLWAWRCYRGGYFISEVLLSSLDLE